jgi:hypothetical protein
MSYSTSNSLNLHLCISFFQIHGSWDGETEKCGCFNNGKDSYFPDDEEMKQSVCDWQDIVEKKLTDNNLTIWTNPKINGFCRLDVCKDRNTNNQEVCEYIKKYGLDNVPTGNKFNSPYPDTQDPNAPVSLIYPNQEYAPGDCKNGNGNGCKNGNNGINSDNGGKNDNHGNDDNNGVKCESFDSKKMCTKFGNDKCKWISSESMCVDATDSISKASNGDKLDGAASKEQPNSGIGMATTTVSAWALFSVMILWFQWQ